MGLFFLVYASWDRIADGHLLKYLAQPFVFFGYNSMLAYGFTLGFAPPILSFLGLSSSPTGSLVGGCMLVVLPTCLCSWLEIRWVSQYTRNQNLLANLQNTPAALDTDSQPSSTNSTTIPDSEITFSA
jgi:hypothetical protein